jgi:hypothetical protein
MLILNPNGWSGSLLLRRECCSFSNGEYVKAGLQELEQWCLKASDQVSTKGNQCMISNTEKKENYSNILLFISQFAGSSWDELRHIRQAVGFLVNLLQNRKGLSLFLGLSSRMVNLIWTNQWIVLIIYACRFRIKRLKNLRMRSQMNSAQ